MILKEYNECKSIKRLSDKYDIPEGTIKNWSFKYNHPDKFLGKGRKRGRKKEKDVHGLIIHSDQGFQYTSYEYKAICDSNGITISMSRKGTPIDDSPIESWHALLKKETLYNNNITSLQEYIQLVEEWILFYNTKHLKSKIKKREKLIQKEKSNNFYFSLFYVLSFLLMSPKWGSHHYFSFFLLSCLL